MLRSRARERSWSPGIGVGVALAALAAGHAAAADPPRTYLALCEDEDPACLEALDALDAALEARDADRAARVADELLGFAALDGSADLLVRTGPDRYMGLRAHVLARAGALPPPAAAALREVQDDGHGRVVADGEALPPAATLARFPASAAGRDAALALLARAFERGDLPVCRRLLALLERFHPDRRDAAELAQRALVAAFGGELMAARGALDELAAAGVDPAVAERLEEAVPALLRARAGRERAGFQKAPPASSDLEHVATVGLEPAGEVDDQLASRCYPAAIDERVLVSDGSVLHAFDLDGERAGRLPLGAELPTTPPPTRTLFQARIRTWRGAGGEPVAFTPLVLERWMAGGRAGAPTGGEEARGDPALAGRYYSLVALDPRDARVRWWDGDPGPRAEADDGASPVGAPAGWGRAGPELLATLRGGHVLDCAVDAARVYVALTHKADEPTVHVFAYARTGGSQPLVLTPAWERATYLFAVERPGGGSTSDDDPVHPEVAAALSLDGEGRLFCATSAGVTACVEVRSGRLQWLQRTVPPRRTPRVEPRRLGPGRDDEEGPEPVHPPEPVRSLPTPAGRLAYFFAADELVAVRAADGAWVWSQPREEATRLLTTGKVLLRYGGKALSSHDPDSGRVTGVLPRLADRRGCLGEAARVGDCLLVPIDDRRRGPAVARVDLVAGGVGLRRRGTWSLVGQVGPVNLAPTPGGVVAASAWRVNFLRWSE